ncbi:MAG: beta-propeller domain-containing protein, partial [Verrucomicrobiota bacterium]
PAAPAEVVESDIWKWNGRTLYFFNQLRGLQVFDFTDPAKPKRINTLRMPAVGEQMYQIDDEHLLLLASRWNYDIFGSSQGSEAILVHHDGDELTIKDRFPVGGAIQESRMVGNELFVVSQLQHEVSENGDWIWKRGLQVHRINLADPDAPTTNKPLNLVDEDHFSYWNSIVTASSNYLFVSFRFWEDGNRKTTLKVIPIGQPGTDLSISHTLSLTGDLLDKFKLNETDHVLTAITQKTQPALQTVVETFDLQESEARRLDKIELAIQERLHATRFDGDRLYIVTFFVEIRKDPLFVIDRSNPSNLKVLGELEIPGWSTYLQPYGDRLLSIGLEDRNVAVSLFDVENPNRPSLIKRLYPGGPGRTWSEANWDEKAVSFLPGNDLLLLPIQSYDEERNWRSLMQIIDIDEQTLVERGAIEHEVNGRRAHAFGDTIISISGQELMAVDATDRDTPKTLTELSLAWNADRVLSVGDEHLIQLAQGNAWSSEHSPSIKLNVTRAENPDDLLSVIALGKGAVAGTWLDGTTLHLLSHEQFYNRDNQAEDRYRTELTHYVIDVADPLNPVTLSSAVSERRGYLSGLEDLKAHPLSNGNLVWLPAGAGGEFYRPYYSFGLFLDFGYYYRPPSACLVAVDLQDPDEPEIAYEANLNED